MSKIKNFLNKPMTWGGYLKLCGVSVVLSTLVSAGMYASLTRSTNKINYDLDYLKEFEDSIKSNDENESE